MVGVVVVDEFEDFTDGPDGERHDRPRFGVAVETVAGSTSTEPGASSGQGGDRVSFERSGKVARHRASHVDDVPSVSSVGGEACFRFVRDADLVGVA